MYPDPVSWPVPVECFPRTRGDVPLSNGRFPVDDRLPPHTRGCTVILLPDPVRNPASPAHAGMYPASWVVVRIEAGFPRTRGDVPAPPRHIWPAGPLPPHTRGCTPELFRGAVERAASPAHAGMYPAPRRGARERPCFPRTRGDVPDPSTAAPTRTPLPPHTRGCTVRYVEGRRPVAASPAHAGMYPPGRATRRENRGFPRTRGDVPLCHLSSWAIRRLPPHTRGCTAAIPSADPGGFASPAHAGMYLHTTKFFNAA